MSILKPNLTKAASVVTNCLPEDMKAFQKAMQGTEREPSHASSLYFTYLAVFCLDRDVSVLRNNINSLLPYCIQGIKIEMERRKLVGTPCVYDLAAVADFHFARIFAAHLIMQPREEIIRVCAETNYGRYCGTPKVNSHEGVFMRMMRAYFLEDRAWLDKEIEVLQTLSATQDCSHPMFSMPKAKWHPLFFSLFAGDEVGFVKAASAARKWYHDMVQKRKLCDGEYFAYVAINSVLLAAIKIGNAYQGFKVDIQDEFLPLEIVEWR